MARASTELEYDTLLYALGSTAADHGVAGVDEHAFHVAARPAALRLRARLDELGEDGRVLVVGGNLTAIEAATEIAESHPGLRVSLATSGELGGWLGAKARRHLARAFDRFGITVHEHTPSSASRRRRRLPSTAPFSPPTRPCGPRVSPSTPSPPPAASRWNPTARSRSTARCGRSRTRMSTLPATAPSSSATTVGRCRCPAHPRDSPACRRMPQSSETGPGARSRRNHCPTSATTSASGAGTGSSKWSTAMRDRSRGPCVVGRRHT